MLPAELWLYWKRVFRVVLPVVLAMDMVHSMYYVAGLYQKRLQEWEQEDHAEACTKLVPVMQHVLKHCHNRDPLLWPPAVTAAFKSSVESIPHLADLASQQPANMPIHQDNVASMAAVKFPASFPRHVNVFADIGLDIGDAELETAVPSAVRQEPNSQLGPQPDKQSNNPTDAPVMSIWAQIQSLLLPQWQLPLLPTSLASRWQGSGKSEIDVRDSAVAAPDVTNLPSSGASHANPQTSAATRIMHQAQQSCMTLADQLSHQAKLQGLPWPMMSCTRRSALRWRVEWHGLQWSYKQDSLELQLDQHC